MDKCAVAAAATSAVADIELVTAIFVCRIDSCSDVLYFILYSAWWVSGTVDIACLPACLATYSG